MDDMAWIWAMCGQCQTVTKQAYEYGSATCSACGGVYRYASSVLRYEVYAVAFGNWRIIETDGQGVNNNW